ncbi:MAG: 16S rRNA (cytidine(1402)-2'-O)-methyltransferase [Alphaproteobacteria bacterium]|nr:16S rRNA (cytidine(1402)-2'-O)-methyltransferase [Alphaproteobacteria bacterium]
MTLPLTQTLGLKPGLYIVATPIGNLEDITVRALRILKSCDLIACEDSRISRTLLSHYSINKPLVVYHDHNADHIRPRLLQDIKDGKSIVLISDAGTPLISDPGYKLVKMCQENDVYYTVIPGACAVISGLVLSGMPSDRFFFAGFVESAKFPAHQRIDGTLIYYESSKRLVKTLQKMAQIFNNRHVTVVREITKIFEEAVAGTFEEAISHFTDHPARGEIVITLSPPSQTELSDDDINALLTHHLKTESVKDASRIVAETLGISKKHTYQLALLQLDLLRAKS